MIKPWTKLLYTLNTYNFCFSFNLSKTQKEKKKKGRVQFCLLTSVSLFNPIKLENQNRKSCTNKNIFSMSLVKKQNFVFRFKEVGRAFLLGTNTVPHYEDHMPQCAKIKPCVYRVRRKAQEGPLKNPPFVPPNAHNLCFVKICDAYMVTFSQICGSSAKGSGPCCCY